MSNKEKPFLTDSEDPLAKATAELEQSIQSDILSSDDLEVNSNLEIFMDSIFGSENNEGGQSIEPQRN